MNANLGINRQLYYGVMTYTVVRRTSDLGVRMVVGVSRAALVLKKVIALLLIGIVLGIPVGLAASRTIRAGLFGTEEGLDFVENVPTQ